MEDAKDRLSLVTIALHWIIAISIIYLLATGIKYPALHKSIGVLILFVVIIRILWRIKEGWFKPIDTNNNTSDKISKKIEPIIARISHWLLLIGTLLLPLSGLLISIAGGYGLSVFGYELLPQNTNPNNIYEILTLNLSIEDFGHTSHTVISNIMIAIVLLHIAGALKHHFIYKDHTLTRMLANDSHEVIDHET